MTYNQTVYFQAEKPKYNPETCSYDLTDFPTRYPRADVRWRATGELTNGTNNSNSPFEYREYISVKSQRPIPMKLMKWQDTIFKPIAGSYKKIERGRGRKWHSCRFMEVKSGGT